MNHSPWPVRLMAWFEEARILRIKKVHADLLFERPPVHLVETMVRT
jgi:hypothetical protein